MENTMKRATAIVLTMAFITVAAAVVLAHPFTFKGTVAAATPTKLSVNIKDAKTGKTGVEVFEIFKDTKILRGDDVVSFEAAHIQKGEAVSITVNLDDGGDHWAEVIRLGSKK